MKIHFLVIVISLWGGSTLYADDTTQDPEFEFLQSQAQNIKLKLPGQTIGQNYEQNQQQNNEILSDEISSGFAGIQKTESQPSLRTSETTEYPDFELETTPKDEFRPARKRSR